MVKIRVLREVYSEKQRRWACAQMNNPASERPKGLSKAEAEEMCKSTVKEMFSVPPKRSKKRQDLGEVSREEHKILNKPRIMARTYKKYLPNDSSADDKAGFLDEIINLAAFADKFAFIYRTKAWGMSDEKEIFEGLVETFLKDPWTKSAMDRIMSIRRGDQEYEVGRPDGFYDLPEISRQNYIKLLKLIDDPDLNGGGNDDEPSSSSFDAGAETWIK